MVHSGLPIILAFLTLYGTISSQAPGTLIQILVDDGHGAAIPHAKIELSPLTGDSSVLSAETDDEGNASFDVPVGSYEVRVSSKSFCPHRWSVEIPSQRTLKLAFDLRVGPCTISTVEVLGAPGSGQQAESPGPISETHLLNVLVTDVTGARVSNADVQARRSESRLSSEASSGEEGHAQIVLGAGDYSVSVRARGFESFLQTVDLSGQSHQTMRTVLNVAGQGSATIRASPSVNENASW